MKFLLQIGQLTSPVAGVPDFNGVAGLPGVVAVAVAGTDLWGTKN